MKVAILLLMLLAGCGAVVVETQETTTDNQPVAATKTEQSTQVSQPTATSEASATSSRPEATPEEPTMGNQPETTTPEAPSSDDVLAVWTRSGGFAGLHEVLTVFADGRLSLEQKGTTGSGQAAPTDFERLQQTLKGPDWQQLEKRYGVQHPDAFQYTIQAKDKTVETFDGSDNPQVLTDLLQQFQALYQMVVPTPGAGGGEGSPHESGTLWVYE